jgi:RHS repeat-associated protein
VSDRETAALFLAACPELVEVASAPGGASAKATSPLKNRVGVFCRRPSGRTGGARRPRRAIAPGCAARGYKPASGRAIDGNGNVIAYVDMATGAKSATYEYGAFGETLIADGVAAEAMPFRFSTKYTDSETGLLYYGYRYYSLSTGRWLGRDSIEENGGRNLYVFIENAPSNFIDPNGLFKYKLPELVIPFNLIAVSGRLTLNGEVDVNLKEGVSQGACPNTLMDEFRVTANLSEVSEKERWGFDANIKASNSASSLSIGYRAGVQIPGGNIFGSAPLKQALQGYFWNERYAEGSLAYQRWFNEIEFKGQKFHCVCANLTLAVSADAELRWHPAATAALAGGGIAVRSSSKVLQEIVRWLENFKRFPQVPPVPN